MTTTMTDEELIRHVGLSSAGGHGAPVDRSKMQRAIAVKLAAQGFEIATEQANKDTDIKDVLDLTSDLFRVYHEQSRLLESHLCPIDNRIQAFLDDVFKMTGETVKLPTSTVVSLSKSKVV
jgi:hypothetical protein